MQIPLHFVSEPYNINTTRIVRAEITGEVCGPIKCQSVKKGKVIELDE